MTPVGKSIVDGLRSLNSLLTMMGESCDALELNWKYNFPEPNWFGIKIELEQHGRIHFGIDPSTPELIQFGSWNEVADPSLAQGLNFEPYEKRGKVSVWSSFDLTRHDGEFFMASADKQFEMIAYFLGHAIQTYQQLEIKKISPW